MGIASTVQAVGGLEREPRSREPFRHEALLYSGERRFVERISAFVREGLALCEPVLVLVIGPKIEMLMEELGRDARRVLFGDMAEVGRNPARVISVWREFVGGHSAGGRRVRGIGEPIWAERTIEELVEAQRHESLINLAFAGAPATVLCLYDLNSLRPSVIEEARRSHPFVTAAGINEASSIYRRLAEIDRPLDDPLLEPAATPETTTVTIEGLSMMRALIACRAAEFGLPSARAEDLVLAVNEVATNSLRHGSPPTVLRSWEERDELVFEVADRGRISAPLAGRRRPTPGQESGYGLWMANQLCDLVQLRSFPFGSAVRVRMTRR